jgi:hypothetical protein
MNTLTTSIKLQNAGLDRKIADEVAQAIAEHNKELSTKRDLYMLGGIMIIAFGYVFSLLNTVISKLG